MLAFIILYIILAICVEQYCRRNQKTLLEHLHQDWFEDVTTFPVHAFPCKRNHLHYNDTIEHGSIKMRETRIVFTGLCINIESKIPSLLKRLEHLGSFFSDYQCVVFENDSTDRTRELLTHANHIHLVPCSENIQCTLKQISAVDEGTFSDIRMAKMTDYRNRLLTYIVTNFCEYDCVCMLDLDIDGPIDLRGIAHSFGLYDLWDSISAQGLNGITLTMGIPIYYDLLAYKDDHVDLDVSKWCLLPILLKTNGYNVGDLPYKVQSGFCGLALYKMNVLRTIDYTPKDGVYCCEHITLHKNMIDQGYDRIYINPNMLVLVGAQGDVKRLPLY